MPLNIYNEAVNQFAERLAARKQINTTEDSQSGLGE
jgi:hypothetical protein